MSIKRIPQLTIIFLALLVIGLGVRYTKTSTVSEPTLYDIRDKLEAPYDPVDRVATLGRKNEIGDLTTCRIAVSRSSDTIEKRGYTTVYCLGHMNIAYQEGYNNIVLLNQDSTPITYPLNPDENKLAYRLKEVLDSRYVNFRGELYNCSAWDGSWFLGLKIGNEKIFAIRYDPKPLDASQFTFRLDSFKYVSDGTVKISIYNWSEDWLSTGHYVDLYKWLNGTWAQVETEWVVPANIIMFFPGTTFTENVPLSELAPGEYKLTKQVWRDYENQFTVEAQFSIVEPVTIDPQYMEDSPFNLFAFDLFNQIYEEGENLVFSPTSIHQVLGMIQEGARNETAEEMRQVLHLPVNDTLRREAYRENMVPSDQVETANAVWIDEHYPVLKEYMDAVSEYFMGEAENIDYSNAEQARGIINQWAENRTHGRITELLPENSITLDTELVLTNAIYLQGAWKHSFNTSLTKQAPFTINEYKTVIVDMMKLKKSMRCLSIYK